MILVTGATGLNGSAVIRRLSARGVPVRALVRSVTKAEELSQLPLVEIVVGDLARPETLSRALLGVDRAMLVSSSDQSMLEVQSNFIAAAAKAGVAHVVKLSGIMPELDSPFRYARMHGETERRLEASGMAFTHLRAGEFMQSYFRQVPSIVAKGTILLPMEDAKIASIDVGDIAEVVPDRRGGSESGDIGSEEWVENGLLVGPDGERNVIVFRRVEVELAHILIHLVFLGALRKDLPGG